VVSGLNYTVFIITLVCADEGLQEARNGVLCVSALFCTNFQRGSRQLLNPTIPTVLTRRSSPPRSAFRCTKRMLSQKGCVESEWPTWRRGLYCKEKSLTYKNRTEWTAGLGLIARK